MPLLSRSLVLCLRIPVDRLLAWQERRRLRKQRATAELNMQRIDTEAFPMLREIGRPRADSPPTEHETRE
jgi:hypothetical protein